MTFFAESQGRADAGRSEPRRRAGRGDAGRVGGAMENAAGGHDGEPHSRSETGRGHSDHRSIAPGGRAGEPGAPLRATSSRCSCISDTDADCRSRSRFRIRGVGRWIPTRRKTIRPSRASGDRCCAGSRATFPSRVVVSLPTDQANPKNPIAIRASVADSMFIARNDAKVVAHLTSDSGVQARSAARLGDRSRRRVSRNVHARSAGHLHGSRRRVVPDGRRGRRHDLRARRRSQHRVLRRRDARAAAQAHRERNGRAVLHAGDGEHASPKTWR